MEEGDDCLWPFIDDCRMRPLGFKALDYPSAVPSGGIFLSSDCWMEWRIRSNNDSQGDLENGMRHA